MKTFRKYALLFVITLITCGGIFLHKQNVLDKRFHSSIIQPASDDQVTSDATDDDDAIYAEDNDGDDFSETLLRLLPAAIVLFAFTLILFSSALFFTPAVISVRRDNFLSKLRVFRI
ncbi:MAG: hypothetical protein HY064_09050 [Bacteroidetes bacterium]|nr:hypothetical protein [Bacteroidota bacterium]